MRRVLVGLLFALILFGTADAASRCTTCARDTRGRIARDSTAVRQFKQAHPKPPGCTRCEVDHITPLHQGGSDTPNNMQWLPRTQHREKTRREAREP